VLGHNKGVRKQRQGMMPPPNNQPQPQEEGKEEEEEAQQGRQRAYPKHKPGGD